MPHSAVRHSTSHANSAPRRRGGPHLQACSGSEAAFDEANSSSRASPRYVSMTFTSAAQIGTGCPRLSPTRGSPSGDALRGGAARPAAPRAGRSRPSGGGPRQLGSSMPGPRTVSVAASAGRIRCASRQPVRTIASASWLGVAGSGPTQPARTSVHRKPYPSTAASRRSSSGPSLHRLRRPVLGWPFHGGLPRRPRMPRFAPARRSRPLRAAPI